MSTHSKSQKWKLRDAGERKFESGRRNCWQLFRQQLLHITRLAYEKYLVRVDSGWKRFNKTSDPTECPPNASFNDSFSSTTFNNVTSSIRRLAIAAEIIFLSSSRRKSSCRSPANLFYTWLSVPFSVRRSCSECRGRSLASPIACRWENRRTTQARRSPTDRSASSRCGYAWWDGSCGLQTWCRRSEFLKAPEMVEDWEDVHFEHFCFKYFTCSRSSFSWYSSNSFFKAPYLVIS